MAFVAVEKKRQLTFTAVGHVRMIILENLNCLSKLLKLSFVSTVSIDFMVTIGCA